MTYGLYDTKDGLWMGDESGPLLFDSEKDIDSKFAGVRAQMVDAQLGQATGRTRAQEWKPGALRWRDERPVVRDAETALSMLEEGLL